ncbi:AI-2E family transporter [Parvibium lacunae]|uniref:AI-2E family transporter n=1 Tax=Parvibium lacunae TaxID=1888893 RepID=A0A368L7N2_9BURK|nr:AI-2E family transporter [Parvibium lacunae]RCS59626.1 AI-2E family transporter [Parvibium lacunae]
MSIKYAGERPDRRQQQDTQVQAQQRSRWLISLIFSLAILSAGLLVLQPFLLAILWAAIIATSSWRLHRGIYKRLQRRRNLAAFCTTCLIGFALVAPLVLLITFAVRDVIALSEYLIEADTYGTAAPQWLINVPMIGDYLLQKWQTYLAQPDQISGVLRDLLSAKLSVLQGAAQSILFELTGRVATLFFALWVLYFFYRDGAGILSQINRIGYKWLERRWPAYVHIMPDAIRAAVNGLILVAVAEAVLLAGLLYFAGVPSAVLLGALIAVLAFIPMLAPGMLVVIGFLLFASGATVAAFFVVIGGNLIVLAADYVVRPALIQGGTQLPFIAILFGIFGGIVTMGIVGLIIGPVLLVALLVFFREAGLDEAAVSLDFNTTTQADKYW